MVIAADWKTELVLEPDVSRRTSERGLTRRAAVIVAHPDDEVLWAGGYILSRPDYNWFIMALTRRSDTDRAPKFYRVLEHLQAEGDLGDLDDGVKQIPLPISVVQNEILQRLQIYEFDIILTHGPRGEYTRHRRHEETSAAVFDLWKARLIQAQQLWMFAYEDDGGRRLPQYAEDADFREVLSEETWRKKYHLITVVYGFSPLSWEARVTPRVEAFHCFGYSSP
jgi:LmbE family N-acetylglucosaminyl deacetylase